jgi:hypothetical protein
MNYGTIPALILPLEDLQSFVWSLSKILWYSASHSSAVGELSQWPEEKKGDEYSNQATLGQSFIEN